MIFEIELDGEVFWADGICFLEGDEINYWKGCMCDEAPGVEGLFTGKYTAKRKVKIEDIITT